MYNRTKSKSTFYICIATILVLMLSLSFVFINNNVFAKVINKNNSKPFNNNFSFDGMEIENYSKGSGKTSTNITNIQNFLNSENANTDKTSKMDVLLGYIGIKQKDF